MYLKKEERSANKINEAKKQCQDKPLSKKGTYSNHNNYYLKNKIVHIVGKNPYKPNN